MMRYVKMCRRPVALLTQWLIGLVLGLVLAFAALLWRLSIGPLSLDFIAPYVAAAMERAEPGLAIRIDRTLVSLQPRATIEIVARGVHLGERSGEAGLTLPELSLGLSLRAALTGVIAPTIIILRQPELRLERAEDGAFHLGLGGDATPSDNSAEAFLRALAAPPDRQGPLGYLTEVAVRNAVLTVNDRALGVTWRAKRADATMFRSAGGTFGDLAVAVEEPGGASTEFHGDFRYTAGEQRFAMQLGLADLRLALLAGTAPGLAPLATMDLPLSGQLRLELDTAALRISDAWCDLTLGAGRVVHPLLQGGAVAVASGQLRGAYDPSRGRVTIEQLRFDLGGPVINASGTVDGLGSGFLAGGWPQAIDVNAELDIREVPTNDLPSLWPEQLAPKPRVWITEHIHDGTATHAHAELGAHVDLSPDTAMPVKVNLFAGTLEFRGLTVQYFEQLPPLRGVDGSGTFDRTRLDLTATAGAVEGVQVVGGTAKLSKLDTHDEEIAIDVAAKGPLRDIMDVLDSDPLHYAQKLHVAPAAIGGAADGHVLFNFPLKRDLSLEEVDFGAQAAVSGAAIAKIVGGRDLSDGAFQLKLDRTAIRLDGTARIADVPASVSWVQSLKAGEGDHARYTMKARIDDAARQRLDVDFFPDMLHGPVDADVVYTTVEPKHAAATVSLALKDATLDIAKLNWRKPAGVIANATLDLELIDGHVRNIKEATIKGGGADARLSVAFDAEQNLRRVDAPRLIAGETDASGSVGRRAEGGWQVELRGLAFDATGLAGGQSSGALDQPFIVDVRLDRLLLGPKREARDVRAQVFYDGAHWQAASVDASLFGGGKARLRFGQAQGRHNLQLTTDDFGGLMRLMNVTENIAGGQLEVTGQVEDQGGKRALRGKVDGADYRLVNAPIFARLLSVASFSAIGSLLSGEGIPFTRLKADFVLRDGKIDIDVLRAYGGAIGVNVSGSFDTDNETFDIGGTLVPAYAINSVLGEIPVLGKILVGGQGEGIFAANFKIAGPVSDAHISVNPLSALAPGILRKLFLFEAPDVAAPAPPPPSAGNERMR
jgi:Protein of unknown function/AsmA-like C-terminal region